MHCLLWNHLAVRIVLLCVITNYSNLNNYITYINSMFQVCHVSSPPLTHCPLSSHSTISSITALTDWDDRCFFLCVRRASQKKRVTLSTQSGQQVEAAKLIILLPCITLVILNLGICDSQGTLLPTVYSIRRTETAERGERIVRLETGQARDDCPRGVTAYQQSIVKCGGER